MFTTIFVYLTLILLIFWSYAGYILILTIFACLQTSFRGQQTEVKPFKTALLIPCFNEEALAASKVANTRALLSQPDTFALFLLGACTDGTADALRAAIAETPGWRVIETGCTGKIQQLNYGLALLDAAVDLVVCTDMDAELAPDTLQLLSEAFQKDHELGVVGANIEPQNCISIERAYWDSQNIMRILESEVYSSSIVVAPCYAFRRAVLDAFPDDCIADDVYVAFQANSQGWKTRYLASAKGRELRAPLSVESFIRHKFRKGNAYLRELLRFLYLLPQMPPWWKIIFLTKFVHLALMPWALPFFAFCTLSMLFSGGELCNTAIMGTIFLFLSLLTASFSLRSFRRSRLDDRERQDGAVFLPFAISNLILVLVGLSYPFYRQTSRYQKIRG